MEYRLQGYTIIELLMAMVIIGIIISIGFNASTSITAKSRDSERKSDIETIARKFEKEYYTASYANGPSYPSISASTPPQVPNMNYMSSLFPGDSINAIKAPGETGISVKAATNTGPQSPKKNEYIYQPFTSSDTPTLCISNGACVRFTLWYLTEVDNQINRFESVRQQ